VSGGEWRIEDETAGARLDKYLASPERLGSRARAVTALERGKVYLNGAEARLSDAGVRLAAGDTVRVWMDRPGSARPRREAVQKGANLEIVFEVAVLLVVN
jgi:23S rRNA-/tRNA-specific pseudouridylate synthase